MSKEKKDILNANASLSEKAMYSNAFMHPGVVAYEVGIMHTKNATTHIDKSALPTPQEEEGEAIELAFSLLCVMLGGLRTGVKWKMKGGNCRFSFRPNFGLREKKRDCNN